MEVVGKMNGQKRKAHERGDAGYGGSDDQKPNDRMVGPVIFSIFLLAGEPDSCVDCLLHESSPSP